MRIIEVKKLNKIYGQKQIATRVIRDIDLVINRGEFISILGPSGSGKTTLLYLLSGLETYSSGRVNLYNKEISDYSNKEMALLRQEKIGFVFQFFNLVESLNVYENILLAKIIANKKDEEQITTVLEMVGMLEYRNYYPNQLSGGMQQRVAIARALVNNPEVIFADEPIGNLDYKNGIAIMEIFARLNKELNKTIVLVTHNEDMIKYGTRVIRLMDGEIIQDEKILE